MKKSSLIQTLIACFSLAFSIAANAQETSFQDFLNQFPKAALPFSLQERDMLISTQHTTEPARLDWAFFEFLPELEASAQFSRMIVYPEPIARFESGNNHVVLYNLARGLHKNSKYFTLSVYDQHGTHLGTHYVGGIQGTRMHTFTIQENLKAVVRTFEGPGSNSQSAQPSIQSLRATGQQMIELLAPGNANGLIISASKGSEMRASLFGGDME
jgi:hypothetical protein